MKSFKHCLIMWIPFGLLFTFAGFGLEALEGTKITTSEYLGLRDLGLIYLFIVAPFAFLLYPISFFPLTLIINKCIKALIFKAVTYTFIGGIIGGLVFKEAYNFHDYITEYDLNIISAVIIFSIAGLLYALLENYFKKKITFA